MTEDQPAQDQAAQAAPESAAKPAPDPHQQDRRPLPPARNIALARRILIRRIRAGLRAGIEAGQPPDLPELRALLDAEAPAQRIEIDRALAGRGSFSDLRRFSNYARLLPPQRYAAALHCHDPALQLPELRDVLFTGKANAKGGGSLNAYRAVTLPDGIRAFEKIYDARARECQRMYLFHAEIAPVLADHAIATPAALLWARGDRLAVLYTRFLSVARRDCPEPVFLDRLAALSRFALASAPTLPAQLGRHDLPWLRGFTRDSRYRRGMTVARAWLPAARFAQLAGLAARVAALPPVLAHGDLSAENVLANGMVIDFDMWGLYPPFYDIALAMAASHLPDRFDRAQDYVDHIAATLLAPRDHADLLSLLFLTVVLRLGMPAAPPAPGAQGSDQAGLQRGFMEDLLTLAER